MKFAGIEKLSLTDYPKKVAATVFTSGCNFNCKYCHNQSLIKKTEGIISETEIFDFFHKRTKMLDALVITGGEPTLHGQELLAFCQRFKDLFPRKLLKIDTNGSHPELMEEMAQFADFCAMDFKSYDYHLFSKINLSTVEQSLQKLKTFSDFEVRITLFPEYVTFDIFKKMINVVKFNDIKKITLQQYRPLEKNEKIYEKIEIEGWFQHLSKNEIDVLYRGFQ